MPRPKRKEIKLTHESAVSLMQEIYNECVEQRSTAIRIQNKMIGFMHEAADMALIGPVLKEQQKIIDSTISKCSWGRKGLCNQLILQTVITSLSIIISSS